MPPTPIWPVDPSAPDPTVVRRAADLIRAGRLVAFPTETVYGLGANALDPAAVAGIYAAKGRPATNPVIVHVADPVAVPAVAATWPDAARQLAERFWPGPLTLVVPKAEAVPDGVTGGGPTVAVRCPAHPVARALLVAAGVPIAAPSANRSGELSPTTAAHVLRSLDGKLDAILDGGPCPGGLESTVVDVSGPVVRLLRPGLITVVQLEAVVGPVELGPPPAAPGAALPAPGMLARHYAPRTALECAETAEEAGFLAGLYETAGLKVARLIVTGAPVVAAARLYADLHALDEAGYDRIIVTLPPATDEWRAVRDRLTRAAAEE
ncbi:L-threonylcarbamoyladenylate synthase [Fimbriiglobus ruber]|nr:L-threonylcarbamoyladenylate synthase [Fimbriiglobus ruber]